MLGLALHTRGGGRGVNPSVYYNRPYLTQTVSYSTYDEAWRRINGANDYNDAIPDEAYIQQVEPDFGNGRIDYLKYFNSFGHKFRFTGINGGYYDEADGNYYDVNGTLSTKVAEFPTVIGAVYWIIDHLTGFMFPSSGFSNISYSNNLTSAASSTVGGYSDFFVFSRDEMYTLVGASYTNATSSVRPPWNMSSQQWTCSPWPSFPTTNAFAWTGTFGGSTSQQAYSYASFQEYYGRIHLTGTIPQP